MDKSFSSFGRKGEEFNQLWLIHRGADWPSALGAVEGQLMTIDTVMSGCVNFFLAEQTLDSPRVVILRDCLDELRELLVELEQDTKEYFERLESIGVLLLEISSSA